MLRVIILDSANIHVSVIHSFPFGTAIPTLFFENAVFSQSLVLPLMSLRSPSCGSRSRNKTCACREEPGSEASEAGLMEVKMKTMARDQGWGWVYYIWLHKIDVIMYI